MKKLQCTGIKFCMLFSMAACSGSKVSDDALDKLNLGKEIQRGKNANYSADMI